MLAAVGQILTSPCRKPAGMVARLGGFVGQRPTLGRTPRPNLWGLRSPGAAPPPSLRSQLQRAVDGLLLRA